MANISKRNILHILLFLVPITFAVVASKYIFVNHSPKATVMAEHNSVAIKLDSMSVSIRELSLAVKSLKSEISEMKDSISSLRNSKKASGKK